MKTQKNFQPGRGYSKADWDAVSDPHTSTADELAQARPFKEVFPDLHAKIVEARKAGRPKAAVTKQAVSLRLDQDVVAGFKAMGSGWQTRINEILKQHLKGHR